MKILNSYWFSPMREPIIGVVKVLSGDGEGIKYYIGTACGKDKETDEQLIASTGARFPDSAGSHLFDGAWL
jgi:hypothetical protein